jgi:hopanoid C-3 methylase
MIRRETIALVHLPTVALKVKGFTDPQFAMFADSGAYLGNVYRRIIPPSLPRIAAVIEAELPAEAAILDIRAADHRREETYKEVDWEGYVVEARRVGGAFELADDLVSDCDWLGLSSHFTFESDVVRQFIAHARQINPAVKIMVGGADVKARPRDYLRFGADLAFLGDFQPTAFEGYDGTPTIVPEQRYPFRKLTTPAFDKLEQLGNYDESHDGPVPDGVGSPIAFTYLTRGCPRECDFCESRRTRFEVLDFESCVTMLEHYRRAGIQTLNFADDNLLLAAAKPDTREQLLALFQVMRDLEFAWEYPNGLEIGRLIDKDGELDEELMETMFSHTVAPHTGKLIGAYRVYVPVETFDRRHEYRKLKPLELQNKILRWLARAGLIEIDFGVVLPPSADGETFKNIQRGYSEIREIITEGGETKARYAVFHLIPISLYRGMKTKYSVDAFPEGWNFYFPVYDGDNFSARELFERRLEVVQEVDPANFESMLVGRYDYA